MGSDQNKMLICLLFNFWLFTLIDDVSATSKPLVKTNWGLIKGVYQTFNGKEIRSFLGIPYALPPVGPLRFTRPIPLPRHHFGAYNANQFGPACLQTKLNAAIHSPNTSISENCLFLNVWTPRNVSTHSLLPVFVYVHGSSFTFGSSAGQRSRGDILTAYTDIIVVNLNHRLGATGFAFGSSDSIVGNQGIHDVLLALKWVKTNIKGFGGDPDRVTLSGMSSGAIVSSAVFLTPALKEKLFHKIVLMSGVPVDYINAKDPKSGTMITKMVSKAVGCSNDLQGNLTSFDIGETICLKTVKSESIADSLANSAFTPVYGDKYIFPTSPNSIVNGRQFPKGISFLVGTEADEALFGREYTPYTISGAVEHLSSYVRSVLPTNLNVTDLASKYFDDVNETDVSLIQRRYIDFLSDISFHCPSLLFSSAFAKDSANTVYLYRNDYVTSYFTAAARPYGAVHADDHRLFLGEPLRSPEMYTDSKDTELSLFMMKTLANFVKGNQLFWPPIRVTGSQISLPRWRIQNNQPMEKTDSDEDKEICLEWAKYLDLKI